MNKSQKGLPYCQLRWEQMHIFRFLQKYLIEFKPGHIHRFVYETLLLCVHRVIVLLQGKPSAQCEVMNALDWVFIKAISIFWCIELFFHSDVSLSPCLTTWLLAQYSAGDEQSMISFKHNA